MLVPPGASYTSWLSLVWYIMWFCPQIVGHVDMNYYYSRENPCTVRGGHCTDTYSGCEDGDLKAEFVRGLCAGPDYWQCCVIEAAPPEPVYLEPWRMCYSCEYSLSNGEMKGLPACQDPFRPNATIPEVNCTDHCVKQVINLDRTSQYVKRSCGTRCYNDAAYPDYVSSICCYGNLCNTAPAAFTLAVGMELCMLIALTLLRDWL